MQQSYFTKYVIIGLSTIALSLSGMESDNNQLTEQKKSDYTVTIVPSHYYRDITEQNKSNFQKDFARFGINLGETKKILDFTKSHIKNNKTNEDIDMYTNTKEWRKAFFGLPMHLPIDAFTEGKKYIVTKKYTEPNKSITIELVSDTNQPEEFFTLHEEPQNPNSREDVAHLIRDFNYAINNGLYQENK